MSKFYRGMWHKIAGFLNKKTQPTVGGWLASFGCLWFLIAMLMFGEVHRRDQDPQRNERQLQLDKSLVQLNERLVQRIDSLEKQLKETKAEKE
jgi:hypothetical protein